MSKKPYIFTIWNDSLYRWAQDAAKMQRSYITQCDSITQQNRLAMLDLVRSMMILEVPGWYKPTGART